MKIQEVLPTLATTRETTKFNGSKNVSDKTCRINKTEVLLCVHVFYMMSKMAFLVAMI